MKTDRPSLYLSIGLHLALAFFAYNWLPKATPKHSLEETHAGLVWINLEKTERQWARPAKAKTTKGPGHVQQSLPVTTSSDPLMPFGKNPKGQYPAEALKNSWQGVVWLEFDVDVQGNVTDVRITKSSGHPVLDQEAAENQSHWKYAPGTPGTYSKPYVFRLVGTI